MILSHYSRRPIDAVRDGDPAGQSGAYKPSGLWLSIDGDQDWREWCQSEDWGCGTFLHYRVTLAPDARVLRLSTADAVFAFSGRYGRSSRWPHDLTRIDWPAVAEQHDGLIIAPYQWACRLDDRTNWYYSWDCASGVIWRARAVASIELLGETVFVGRTYETA